MPKVVLRGLSQFEAKLSQIRASLDIAEEFTPTVLQAAANAEPYHVARFDALDLPFVAIDPAGATDLDQAFFAKPTDHGYTVHYAIADVGAFLTPGDPVDEEALRRGATMYSPDRRCPLHPPTISEDRASLLPNQVRPALLWTFQLDQLGGVVDSSFQRATVRVREAITYTEAQHRIDAPDGSESDDNLLLLRTIGQLRQQLEVERGGVSLCIPAQEIHKADGGYVLAFETTLPVEKWNAQISLMTGMTASEAMAEAGVGLLRTLPPPDSKDLELLRQTAHALGVAWDANLPYADFARQLRPTTPQEVALLIQATRTFRGAGYLDLAHANDGPVTHAAIGSVYGHVTAPLRRLVDRFANEVLLAIYADETPPTWAVEALDALPSIMGTTKQRESSLNRQTLDLAEAVMLEPHVGKPFDGIVINQVAHDNKAVVQIADPAVVTNVRGENLGLADKVALLLQSVDVEKSEVVFEPQPSDTPRDTLT